jgi:hypothetical protein
MPPEAGAWLSGLLETAVSGTGTMPHPHPDIPAAEITFEQLCRAIADNYSINGRPWSVPEDGYPPVPGVSMRGETESARSTEHDDPGTLGSAGHNLLHNLLGDFH